jgi:hypothetical protein
MLVHLVLEADRFLADLESALLISTMSPAAFEAMSRSRSLPDEKRSAVWNKGPISIDLRAVGGRARGLNVLPRLVAYEGPHYGGCRYRGAHNGGCGLRALHGGYGWANYGASGYDSGLFDGG